MSKRNVIETENGSYAIEHGTRIEHKYVVRVYYSDNPSPEKYYADTHEDATVRAKMIQDEDDDIEEITVSDEPEEVEFWDGKGVVLEMTTKFRDGRDDDVTLYHGRNGLGVYARNKKDFEKLKEDPSVASITVIDRSEPDKELHATILEYENKGDKA